MAETFLTAADLLTINDRNLSDFDVPNFFAGSPFMRVAASTIATQPTAHKHLRYTLPAVGYRAANLGREVQKSVDTLVTITLAILDATFRTDLALADDYKDGRDAWVDREAGRHLVAAMFAAEKQVFRGTTDGDANGFAGFPDDASLDALADANVIGAGGTLGTLTSCYIVRFGPEDCEFVWGNDGNLTIDPYSIIEATPASGTGTYPALYVPIKGHHGLKIGSSVKSVVRIANIDIAAAATDVLTDDLIYEGLSKFEDGMGPSAIFMRREAAEQLRKGRTTYNPVGAPAPQVANIEGIPVYTTDGIASGETQVT